MSLLVTLYENIAEYVSDRLTMDPPYQGHRVIPMRMQTHEESMLTRIYEEMEKGLLIPYNLFPRKTKVTNPSLQYAPSYMSPNPNPNVVVVDLGV